MDVRRTPGLLQTEDGKGYNKVSVFSQHKTESGFDFGYINKHQKDWSKSASGGM